MLTLNSRDVSLREFRADKRSTVLRVRRGGPEIIVLGPKDALIAQPGTMIGPGQTVLALKQYAQLADSAARCIIVPDELGYLDDGDVLAVELQRPAVRVLYRRNSRHNSVLLTERCNHYCLMCSQPPKDVIDDWLVDELLEAIPLISPETGSLVFTGCPYRKFHPRWREERDQVG